MEQQVSLIGGGMAALTVLATLAVPYFLPTIIAYARGLPNRVLIFAVNGFAGWTVVMWLWALFAALLPEPEPESEPERAGVPFRVDIEVEVTVSGTGGAGDESPARLNSP